MRGFEQAPGYPSCYEREDLNAKGVQDRLRKISPGIKAAGTG